MNFSLHFQGDELYLTAPSYPGMSGTTNDQYAQVLTLGSRTVSLTWMLRSIVREEIAAALAAEVKIEVRTEGSGGPTRED